jgi:hypothetical protein
MAQAEDIAGLTRAVWRLYLEPVAGLAGTGTMSRLARMRYQRFGVDGLGKVAKLCGVTPELVAAWERGTVAPSTGQFLALLRVLGGGAEDLNDVGR